MGYAMKSFLQRKLRRSLYGSAWSRAAYTNLGVVIREVRCAIPQFYTIRYPVRSLLRCVQVLLSAFVRLLMGRSLRYSFGFRGEDRIIAGILKPIITESGFYVEVGCNHPQFHSNTYGLYRVGWRGICIDANDKLVRKYGLFRPRDIAVCALVSNSEGEVDYYRIENDVLSTVDQANVAQAVAEGLHYEVEKRNTAGLTSILDQYGAPAQFELLSIDAEEHDYEVLTSLDFDRYRPKLVVVEDEEFSFSELADNRFVRFLTAQQYHLVGYVLKNAYFLRKDE